MANIRRNQRTAESKKPKEKRVKEKTDKEAKRQREKRKVKTKENIQTKIDELKSFYLSFEYQRIDKKQIEKKLTWTSIRMTQHSS